MSLAVSSYCQVNQGLHARNSATVMSELLNCNRLGAVAIVRETHKFYTLLSHKRQNVYNFIIRVNL